MNPHRASEGKTQRGAVEDSLPRRARPAYVLTDAHGRYTALLHSPTGRLERLSRGVNA